MKIPCGSLASHPSLVEQVLGQEKTLSQKNKERHLRMSRGRHSYLYAHLHTRILHEGPIDLSLSTAISRLLP